MVKKHKPMVKVIFKLKPVIFGFFLILFVLQCDLLYGQGTSPNYVDYYSEVVPVTPNSSNFKVYGDIPVSHATGTPNIVIPIFTIEEDGVTIPISLSYHAYGVKVDDLSSAVGLKWTLNAGGGIFRQVNDKADEEGWLKPSLQGIVNPTWVASHPLDNSNNQDAITSSDNYHDYRPDDFDFSFNGNSGSFIFTKAGLLQKEQKGIIKLSKTAGVGNLFNFQAQDGNGNTFFFDNKKEFNSRNIIVGNPAGDLSFNSEINVSAWMLDRITTKNNKQINFTYLPYNLNYLTTNISHSFSHSPRCTAEPDNFGTACGCEGEGTGSSTFFATTSSNNSPQNQLIQVIESPSVKVTFNYIDDQTLSTWKKKLVSIVILDKLRSKTKSFSFTYGKFSGDPRLKLDEIKEVGYDGKSKAPHKFFYDGNQLPLMGSMSKDYAGFNNGKTNATLVPFSTTAYNTLNSVDRAKLANRNEDVNFLKIGTLNKIIFPTGGSTNFQYEANSELGGTGNFTYSNRNSSISTNSPSYISGSYTVFRESFTIKDAVLGTLGTKVEYTSYSNICGYDPDYPSIDCSKFNIYSGSGSMVMYSSAIFNPYGMVGTSGSRNLQPGNYVIEMKVLTSSLTGNSNAFEIINLKWLETDPVDGRTKYTGGLRVKSVVDKDFNGTVTKVKNYRYKGLRGAGFDINSYIKSYGEKKVFSSENLNANPSFSKGGHFYDEVTIEEIGAGDTLRTVENYQETFRNKSYEPVMVRQDLFLGAKKIKIMVFEYDNTVENVQQFWTLGDKDFCYTYSNFSYVYQLLGYNNPDSQNYYFRKSELKKIIELDLGDVSTGSSYITKIIRRQYNQNSQLKKEEVDGRYTASSEAEITSQNFSAYPQGQYFITDFTYPNDYGNNSALSLLTNKHLINIPVSRTTTNNLNLVSGQFMEYDGQGNVKAVYRYNKGQETNNSLLDYIPSNYALHASYLLDSGAPVQISAPGGIPTTFLWDSTKKYLLAKLTNVSKAQLDAVITTPVNLALVNDTQLTSTLNNLRNSFPLALTTTYTYEPLVGITSTTDPSGYTSYYEYDGLDQLQLVKNKNGEVLEKYKYNYRYEQIIATTTSTVSSLASGGTVGFTTTASGGSGNFTYKWTVSNANLNQTSTTSTGSFSVITSSSHSPSFTLTCEIRDTVTNEVVTTTKQITVNTSYPSLYVGPMTVSPSGAKNVGYNVTYGVTASGGSGNYSYVWTKTNPQQTILIRNSASTISDIITTQDCNYFTMKCVIKDNVTGNTITSSTSITISSGCSGTSIE